MKKISLFLFIFIFCFAGCNFALARDPNTITDWYISNFESNIVVNKDSSLLITEKITADAGNLAGKHGIFRVLPWQTPIELVSITDFNNAPYKYQEIKDRFKKTITWKIGDANIAVTGKHDYQIVYKIKNAVRFQNNNFDELYWNLLGAFWQIPTDKFFAKIIFPQEINQDNTKIEYYAGYFGQNQKNLAFYSWSNPNTLVVNSTGTLEAGQDITISVSFPKNIFIPYQPTFLEKYGEYFWYLTFLIPLAVFLWVFGKWQKYGKDPKMKTPIPPEFGIPENITPIQMGMILSHGIWKDKFITASIIDLAVRKFITIEQTEDKFLFIKSKDIVLKKNLENYDLTGLTETENILLAQIFKGGENSVSLSNLKNKFYQKVSTIKSSAENDVAKKGWIDKKGAKYAIGFLVAGIILVGFSFWTMIFSVIMCISLLATGFVLILFAIVMPKRTQAGVDLLFKIKGFERYMRQAEDYRQQFYEKENIFDKFLPYAIVFGIAELWAKKMQMIYGDDYFKNYHPVWIAGSSMGSFNIDSFTNQLNSITSNISQSTSSSSGAGGAGGAGGGGGGGGGGGW